MRTDYRKALAEMDKGNWQNARTLLLDLFKRSPTFDVAASLGETEAKLGESAKAAQHFAFALKNVPPKEKAETSTRIRAGLSSVAGNVVTIRISLNRKEAQIFVDGEQVGSYPALSEIYLSPGKHTIEARAAGESEKREVEAVAGSSKSMAFMLVPDSLPASGLAAVPTPNTPSPNEANPTPPSAPTAAPADDSHSTTRTVALIGGGSLAVVGLAVGIGFALGANSAKSDANELKQRLPSTGCTRDPGTADCRALESAVSRQHSDASLANLGFVLAAVGGVTVGAALLWPSSDAQSASASRTSLSLGWAGDRLFLRGRF